METMENVIPDPSGHGGSNARRKPSRQKRDNRQYRGLACANCRARKVRCGGGLPRCKTCEIHDDECRYDKAPPMSQVMAMMKRLQEAEETIARFRTHNNVCLCEDSQSGPSPSSETAAASSSEVRVHTVSLPRSDAEEEATPLHSRGQPINIPIGSSATSREGIPPELSVNGNGEIQYYGPTSAVHDPPQIPLESPIAQASGAVPESTSKAEIVTTLIAHAQESKIWEAYASENASLQTGIPRQIIAKLLHMHWSWVAPMFMYVYRPAFIRDMANDGRYYSEFLLAVICAHAAKYQDSAYAEVLLARVRRLLGTAIQQPSSVPTVQALLQLSAREIANGSISQAWVYSGIAFRMASDLGLEYIGPNIRGLGPVDIEIRKRLFWSSYFWDKATSLYTGRLPAITELPHHSPSDIVLDDSMELETWTPYYGDFVNLTKLGQNRYPLRKSHVVSCFANSCRLSIIINDIIVQLYSRKSRAITEAALQDIKIRLDLWRSESPAHLRYDPDDLPSICPPPHLISQNILYFTTIILAHRPFWSVQSHYQVCISAAQGIEKLVLLLESTFGLENITYLMGYCIYTGASAVLEDARRTNQGTAHPVLRTFIRALQLGMKRCPLLERSLNIIIRGLSRGSLDRQNVPSSHVDEPGHSDPRVPTATGVFPSNSYIPAFPYLDPQIQCDFDVDSYFNDNNLNPLALLDCFPEMQLDAADIQLHL